MPSGNPMAEVINLGGSASAGPVSGSANAGVAVDDHHISAAVLVVALVILWALWSGKFRFSMTTSGG